MAHIFDGDFSRLESDERRKVLPPYEILNMLDIRKGSTIIDFGCGIGYFSIPALDIVGSQGRVIAIDTSERMLEELKLRATSHKNLLIIKSDDIPTNEEIGTVMDHEIRGDLILLVNVLHEIDNPKEFLQRCIEVLNPGGRIAIIDWQKKETDIGSPIHHRIPKEDVISMIDSEWIEHDIDNAYYYLVTKI
ncbi:class I SAM-dependent methyltransferase [Candidatus Woesearchaeota archaeon]|nr:class I SAM-dependent methyltransferase [Candidatus Woesearchaeota archaeon]